MLPRILIIVIAISLFISDCLSSQCPNPTFCTFDHLISSLDVHDIEQIDNVLYLASSGGLVKYDLVTEEYTTLTSNDGLRSNYTLALASDSRGVLWIATIAGLCKYEDDCFFYELQPQNDSPYKTTIDDILVDNQDKLWLCEDVWSGCRLQWYDEESNTSEIIYQCDSDQNTPEVIPREIELGLDGKIWMLADSVNSQDIIDRRITYFDPDTYNESVASNSISTDGFRTRLQISNSGNVWITSNNKFYKYVNALELISEVQANWIEHFVVLENDVDEEDIWFILPFDDRLYLNSMENPADLNGAQATQVFSLDNTIISSTNQGMLRSINVQLSEIFIQIENDYLNNSVSEITSDEFGNVWVAYRNVLEFPVMKISAGSGDISHFTLDNSRNADHITVAQNDVYVHTGGDMFRGNQSGNFQHIELDFGNASFFFSSNILLKEDLIYVGVTIEDPNSDVGYSLIEINGNQINSLGSTTEQISKISFDANNDIYVGSRDGLYHYNGSNLNLRVPELDIEDMDFNVQEDKLFMIRRDIEWFENSMFTYSTQNGLEESPYLTTSSNNLDINGSGSIWLSGDDVQATDGLNNLAGPFGNNDGFPINFSNSIHASEAGTVYVGTETGIAVYEELDFINASQTNICPGETVSFSTQLTGDFEWEIIQFNEVIATSNESSFDFTFDRNANHIIVLRTVNGVCTQADVAQIRVNALATDFVIQETFPLCSSTDSVLLVSNIGMQSYLWTYNGETVSDRSRFYTSIPGEYTLFVEDFCGNFTTVSTVVGEALDINLFAQCDDSESFATLSTSTQFEPNASHQWSTGESTSTISIMESGTYSVTVSFNGCIDEEEIELVIPCDFVSATNSLHESNISFFPNPSAGVYNINSSENIDKIEVLNSSGLRVFVSKDSSALDITELSQGIYFAKLLLSSGGAKVIKLVKY